MSVHADKWWVMLTVSVGVLLATIDGSIVNVALPTLVTELDTTFPVIQWVSLSYLLTLATLTMTVGRAGDVFGKKSIYTVGFSAFTVASVLCGLATSVELLIAFRVLQSLGAAMILSLGAAILVEAFPPSERGRALGLIGTAVSVGITTGPVLGGVLISTFGWPSIFLVNLPVGIVGTLLALRWVPATRPVGGQRFDYAGAALLSGTLLSLSLALTIGQTTGFAAPGIIALFGATAVGAALFVRTELGADSPMVELRLFRAPLLSVGVVTGFLVFAAIGGTFFLFPFYLENIQGRPIGQVGLMLGASSLALGLASPVSGAWSDRVGVRWLTVGGLMMLVLTYVGLLTLDVDTSVVHFVALTIPLGAAAGIFQSPNNSAIMGSIPPAYSGVGGGLLTLTRLLGQVTGIAVLGSLWATRVAAAGGTTGTTTAPVTAQMSGFDDVLVVMIGLLVLAALVGWSPVLLQRRLDPQLRFGGPS